MADNEKTVTLESDSAMTPGQDVQVVVKAIDSSQVLTEMDKTLVYSRALTMEDNPIYQALSTLESQALIFAPSYNPAVLYQITHENNTLNQCVAAMVINVDGTGYEIVDKETGDPVDNEETKPIKAFFDEPWPKESYMSIRRQIRRDKESTGAGYLEVIRTQKGDVAFLRRLDAKLVRLCKLKDVTDYHSVQYEVERFGKKITHKLIEPIRRYVQMVGNKTRYFKQYGAEKHLNTTNGEWETTDRPVLLEDRASEVIEFKVQEDVYTPYGVPRWVNEFPSALGSRAAEELNLEYFRSGGVPPVMVFIQGGAMSQESREELNKYLGGDPRNKNRAVVVEVFSTSGDFNSAGNVKVSVERFGCYSDDTEVLTANGWMLFKDWDGSKVASVDLNTRKLSYDKPIGGLQKYDYTGEMVYFPGAAHNALVTPNHNMVRETHSNGWQKERADVSENRARVRFMSAPEIVDGGVESSSVWIGDKAIPEKLFIEFLGYFIADGSTTKYREGRDHLIKLAAKKDRKIVLFKDCAEKLKGLGVSYSLCVDKRGYSIISMHDKGLRKYLRDKVGTYAENKRIPRMFLSMGMETSRLLLRAMFEGDATHVNKGGRNSYTYSTVSRQLADDVQELAFRCGWRSVLGDDGRGCYYVSVSVTKNYASLSNSKAKKLPSISERVLYSGKVYCFEMPAGTVVTRRNGRVAIHGNSERQKDSLFEVYDLRCAMRIRTSFRIPPMFLGMNEDYNFATAKASYTLAEAQVFSPERREHDEIINMTLMREIDNTGKYLYRSNPIRIKDIENILKALELSKSWTELESWVKEINESTNMNLVADDTLSELVGAFGLVTEPQAGNGGDGDGSDPSNEDGNGGGNNTQVKKQDDDFFNTLIDDWIDFLEGRKTFQKQELTDMSNAIKAMEGPMRNMFNRYVGMKMANPKHDFDGVVELMSQCVDVLPEFRDG